METCLLLVKLYSSYDMESKESYIPKTEQFDKKILEIFTNSFSLSQFWIINR